MSVVAMDYTPNDSLAMPPVTRRAAHPGNAGGKSWTERAAQTMQNGHTAIETPSTSAR
jgi:hypothetical protein